MHEILDRTAGPGLLGKAFFRRNVACVQLAFAAFWVVRGISSMGVGTTSLVACAVLVTLGTFVLAAKGVRTLGPMTRPDFAHPDVRLLARRLSWATVLQLVGSTAIAALLSSVGWDQWVVPSLVATIGLFLIYAGRDLDVALTTKLGWAMTVWSVVPTRIIGTARADVSATVLALGTAALLVASSAACFAVRRTA